MSKKGFWTLFLANRNNLRRVIKTYEFVNKNFFDVEKYAFTQIKRRLKEFFNKPDITLVDNSYKGQNLPFDTHNHRLFAIKMTIFLAIPYSLPFLIVRYQLLKASGGGSQEESKSKNKQEFDPFIHTNAMM